jgi:hypothetical protein
VTNEGRDAHLLGQGLAHRNLGGVGLQDGDVVLAGEVVVGQAESLGRALAPRVTAAALFSLLSSMRSSWHEVKVMVELMPTSSMAAMFLKFFILLFIFNGYFIVVRLSLCCFDGAKVMPFLPPLQTSG